MLKKAQGGRGGGAINWPIKKLMTRNQFLKFPLPVYPCPAF